MAAIEELPPHHADPFERLLIAQALVEPLRLLTHDARASKYSDDLRQTAALPPITVRTANGISTRRAPISRRAEEAGYAAQSRAWRALDPIYPDMAGSWLALA